MDKQIAIGILEEAERWYKAFEYTEGTQSERSDFQAWYKASPDHQSAYAQVYTSYDSGYDLDKVSSYYMSGMQSQRRGHETRTRSLSGFVKGLLPQKPFWAYASAGLAVLFAVQLWFVEPDYTEYATHVGQIDKIELSDGTVITLGAHSKIRVEEFDVKRRHVILEQGEALFAVAKDRTRPFIVSSGGTRIRVLGTVFNVNKARENLTVSLLEGRVRLIQEVEGKFIPFLTTEKTIDLKAAQTVSVREGVLKQPRRRDITEMASWVGGQLNYSSIPLSEVVADLNRYSPKPVIIGDDSLNDLRVTAVFGTDQIEVMVQGLPYLLPLELVEGNKGEYMLMPKGRL